MSILVSNNFKKNIVNNSEKRGFIAAQQKELAPLREEIYDFLRNEGYIGRFDEHAMRKNISRMEAEFVKKELAYEKYLNRQMGIDAIPSSLYDSDYAQWIKELPPEKLKILEEKEKNLEKAIAHNIKYDDKKATAIFNKEKIKEITSYYEQRTAPFLAPRMATNILDGAHVGLIKAAAKAPFSDNPLTTEEAIKQYGTLRIGDFNNAFLRGNNVEREIRHQNVSRGVYQSPDEIKAAISNIGAKNGKFVVWDLETFGPNLDNFGRDMGQRITDFSFSEMNGLPGSGKYSSGKTFGSIIGINEKEYKELSSLIDRYTSGQNVTDSEKVTLDRLARMGNKRTKIDWNKWIADGRGIFRYDDFAEAADIGGTKAEMQKGLSDLLRIGNLQRKTVAANGMFGWEQELLSGLHSIIDNDITAIAHNGAGFDIKHLNALLHDKRTSKAFRSQVNSLLSNRALNFTHSMDTLALMRASITDRQAFFLNFFGGDRNKLAQLNKFMRKNDRSQLTQETLMEAIRLRDGIGRIQSAAHSAESDSRGLASAITSTNWFTINGEGNLVSKIQSGASRALKADGSEIFYALSSINSNDSGLLTFVKDQMSGQFRSSDGISIGNNGAMKESFGQPGLKRRALYSLVGMGEIKQGDKLYDVFSKAHPELNNGSLFYLTLNPYSDSKTVAAQSEVTIVGTEQEIIKQINQTLASSGSLDDHGVFSMDDLTGSERKIFDRVVIDQKNNNKIIAATEKDLVADSTFAFENDAAARVARDKSASKDSKILRYIKDMDKFAENRFAKEYEATSDSALFKSKKDNKLYTKEQAIEGLRQRFRDGVYRKTETLMQERFVHNGSRISTNKAKWSFYDYFGWGLPGQELTLYTNSITNATQLENYVRQNQEVIEQSLRFAEEKTGKTKFSDPLYQAHYRAARDAIEGQALIAKNQGVSQEHKVKKNILGYTNRGRIMGEMGNIFEVDINGFRAERKAGGNIVRFNLGASGISIADDIYQAFGRTKQVRNKIRKPKKIQLLRDFQQFLADSAGVSIDNLEINTANDSLDTAGSKVLSMMKRIRENDPMSGWLTPTEQHDITAPAIKNFGFSSNEINSIIRDKATTFSIAPTEFLPPTIGKDGKLEYKKNSARPTFIEELATDINDKILFNNGTSKDHDTFISQMKEYGYSERDAETLFKTQALKREESQKMVADLLDKIYSNGGMVGYNEQHGKVFMFNSVADWNAGNMHELSLARQTFEEGAFYVRIGDNQTRHIDPLTVAPTKTIEGSQKFTLTSILGQGRARNGRRLERFIYDKAQDGILHEGIDYYLKQLNSSYQTFAAVLSGDHQDRAMTNAFFVGDVTQNMGALARSKALQSVAMGTEQAQQVLAEMMSNPEAFERSLSNLGFDYGSAFLQNIEHVRDAIRENLDGHLDLFDMLSPGMSHTMAHGDKGFMQGLQDVGNALEFTHSGQTGIEAKLKRTAFFDTNSEEFLEIERQGGRAGAALRSSFEQAYSTGAGKRLGYSVENTLIGNRLSATTEDWRNLIAKGTQQGLFGPEGSHTHRLLSSITTDEGASAITSYLADATMSHRYYEQHVRFTDVAMANTRDGKISNYRDILDGKLGDITANIEQVRDENGKIIGVKYSSNNGAFVRKGETLFNKRSTFGNGVERVRAKQTGFLRTGIFQDGLMLTDEAVSNILSTEENLARLNAADDSLVEAYNILQSDKTLRHDFFVDELSISGNTKFSDLNEKNTGRVLIAGLGVADAKVARAMTDFKATELIGKEVTADFVRELMNYGKNRKELAETKFGISINALREEQGLAKLTSLELAGKVRAAGFAGVQDFGQALYRERHSVSDALNTGFTSMGVLHKGEHVFSVVNNFPGQRKHGDTTAIKSMIFALEDAGLSKAQIAAKMQPILPGISYDSTKDYLNFQKGQINFAEYDKLAEELGLDKSQKYMRTVGDSRFEISKTEYRQMQNLDEPRISADGTHAVKIDERVYNNMIAHRYSDTFLDGAETKLKAALGETLGTNAYESFIKGRQAGDLLNESFIKKVQGAMFYTGSEDRVFDSFNTDFSTAEQTKAVQKLKDIGMTTGQIDTVVKNMVKNGATKVSWDKVAEYHTAASHTMAHSFNMRTGKHSLDEMRTAGFKVIGLDDLTDDVISAFNEGGEKGYDRFIESMNGQQFVIDLHSKELEKKGAKQIYANDAQRYLAIPFQAAGKENPDGSTSVGKVNKKIAGMIRNFEGYRDNYVSLTSSPDLQDEKRRFAQDSMESVRKEISVETTAKEGIVKKASTARITDGVAHLSAQGHMMLGNRLEKNAAGHLVDTGISLDGELGKLNIFGKSISELATRNRLIEMGELAGEKLDLGYAILGQEAQKVWYNEELFKTITGGDEALAKELHGSVHQYLDEGGATLTDVMRHPTQRNRSTGAVATFFNKIVGNDEVLLSIREWMQKKGDFDGDKLAEMMLKSKATITWNNGRVVQTDQLDFATYKMLQSRNDVKVQLHDNLFKDAQAEIITAGMDYNPKAEPRNPDMKGGAFDVSKLAEEATWDGKHSIDYGRSYSHEDIQRETSRWKELEYNFGEYAKQKNLTLEKGSQQYLEEMSKYTDTLGSQADAAKETMHFNAWRKVQISARNAEISKQAAGILNTVEYSWQRIASSKALNLSAQELSLVTSSIAAAQEATLTGKSETGEVDIRRVSKMQELHRNAYNAMRTGRGKEEAAEALTNFYRGIFNERANKEFALQPGNDWGAGSNISWWKEIGGEKIEADIRSANSGATEKEINNLIIAEQAARLQGEIVKRGSLKGTSLDALRFGVTLSGFDPDRELTTLAGTAEESMQGRTNDVLNGIAQDSGLEMNVIRETSAPTESIAVKAARRAESVRVQTQLEAIVNSSQANTVTMNAAQKSHRTLGNAIRNIAGIMDHTRGMSALAIGIAGGILTAGYASGPTQKSGPTPAQTHAAEQARDEQEVVSMQQTPSLSDANMNVLRGGPHSGYVININANSSRGQQAAVNAINNAASGMTPRNGSVNVSINNSSDQLDQFQVNRMVANAIGIAT